MKRMMGPGVFSGLSGLSGLGWLGRMGARLGISAAALCLGACVFGGTGSDHENGVAPSSLGKDEFKIKGVSARVVDSAGSPLAGVTLYLYDPAYRPDLGQARLSQLTDTAPVPVTDSLGYASLDLSAPGKFVVEGVSGGKTLFFDTLATPVLDKAALFTFRIRASAVFRGKVSLVSGMRIDSGSVFIRGTSRTARLDASGNYDLGGLPWDAGRMGLGVRYVSSPTTVLVSKQVSLNDSLTVPSTGIPADAYACAEVAAKEATAVILDPQPRAPGAETGILAKDMADSTKLGRALNACDTLTRGGVVNVVSRDSSVKEWQTRDSTAVAVLVLEGETSVSSFNGTKVLPATVIPYAGCVPSAGRETTSFEVKVQTTAAKSDILIADVAAACLEK